MTGLLATATAAASGATVAALVNGTPTVVRVARDLTVASDDVIIVQKIRGQWFALGRAYSAAPAATNPTAPPDPKPSITTGKLVVSPVETRSYRATYGWRTDNTDVYQGQYGGWGNHIGAVFYGSKLRTLTGATVTDARVQVRRLTAGTYAAQTTTLRLMEEATRPSGSPTLGASTSGPSLAVGATGTFTVPDSWAQAMVDGDAGGLAIYDGDGSPYVRLAGRGSWSPAWTLTVSWRRG
ncbi:hypothetical protein ABNF97_09425 [Plantactinospora sp. B6F1]|uniref:hypothetical protein n=1 Tax=Plantactinospora sp. B6F1 TaxID=3158971 RepID=UPI0032D92FF7